MVFELDVELPEDWKLDIQIWNRGLMKFTDNLIGATTIDLENRLHSNTKYLN